MTDRFLFSILSTTGIISGTTALSFGGAYVVGKYTPKSSLSAYISKKVAEIASIEDIKEYEDIQGCKFLFKNKSLSPTDASSSGTSSTTSVSSNVASSSDYKPLEKFMEANRSVEKSKIVGATEKQRSRCSNGSAVYVDIQNS